MKLPKTFGKVSPDLARKLQPLLDEAIQRLPASDLTEKFPEMEDMKTPLKAQIQAALLWSLESTPARIGVATAKRLLENPEALLREYLMEKRRTDAIKQANFDKNLVAMVGRISKTHTGDTLKELRSKFPKNRSFRDLAKAAKLHVENKGRPLTPVDMAVLPGVKLEEVNQGRLIKGSSGNVVLLQDGEVLLKDGSIVPDIDAQDVEQIAYKAPPRPQMDLSISSAESPTIS